MSIRIYPVSAGELAARLAPRAQREALAPFPAPRLREAPWQLNRTPLDFPEFTELGRARKIELGEEPLPAEGAPAEAALRPAPTARAPAAGGARAPAAGGAPETLSWAWYCAPNALGATAYATTDAIPWPCRVVGFSFDTVTNPAITSTSTFNLFPVDAEYTGVIAGVIGTPLIPFAGDIAALVPNLQFGPIMRVQPLVTTNEAIFNAMIATTAIGSAVLEAGKRIAIGVRNVSGEVQDFAGHITVERIGAITRFETRVIRAPAAPIKRPAPIKRIAPLAPIARPIQLRQAPPPAPTSLPKAPKKLGGSAGHTGHDRKQMIYTGQNGVAILTVTETHQRGTAAPTFESALASGFLLQGVETRREGNMLITVATYVR